MNSDDDLRVLLRAEFAAMASSWTEHLCLQRRDMQILLSSCGYGVLAEAREFAVEDPDGEIRFELPEEIDGQAVVGIEDGEYVIGGDLVPQDDDAEIVLEPGEIEEAREWLEGREWHLKPGFEEAWREIERALAVQEAKSVGGTSERSSQDR